MAKNYDAFLSYNSQDSEFAEKLAKYLRDKASINVWFDRWELRPGALWQEAIENALNASQTVLVLIGEKGLGRWVATEFRAAFDPQRKNVRIIPILLPKADPKDMPEFLANISWVDLREWDNTSLQRLVAGIKGITPGKSKSPKVFLCHANEDSKRVENLFYLLRDEGLDPWFDKENLLVGDRWEDEIYQAIEKSDFFAICLSKTSVNKTGFIQKEIRTAVNEYQRRPQGVAYLLPVKLETCKVPEIKLDSNTRLADLQWIDVFKNDINAVKKLAMGIWKQWEKSGKSKAA